MFDVGAIASFITWIANYPDWEKLRRASRRRRFLVKVGTDLVENEINRSSSLSESSAPPEVVL